jgi:hypothetical protein
MEKSLKQRLLEESPEERRARVDALNDEARERWRAASIQLSPIERRVTEELAHAGFAHVDVRELCAGDGTWALVQQASEEWLASDDVQARERAYIAAERHKGKDYLIRRYGRDAAVEWDAPWLRWAVHPSILNVTNAYLGMFSKVIYLDVWDTVPPRQQGPSIGSQRWHRDPEDVRLVKTFLYLRDVSAAAGPFEYVPFSRAGETFGGLWPQEFPAGSVAPADEFDRAVPEAARHVCVYPAGTLLFVDTTGFHRGGQAVDARRVLATCTYVPPACVWPRAFRLEGAQPDTVSQATRFALLTPDSTVPA